MDDNSKCEKWNPDETVWISLLRWIYLQDLGESADHCLRIKEKDRSSKSNPRAHHLYEENPALNSIGEQTTHGDQSRSQTTNLLI